MNNYELTIILDGKATPAKVKAFNTKLGKVITLLDGKMVETKEWGKKDLAYKIKKSDTGFYLFGKLELLPGNVKKLSDKLRVDEEVLRYLLVKEEK